MNHSTQSSVCCWTINFTWYLIFSWDTKITLKSQSKIKEAQKNIFFKMFWKQFWQFWNMILLSHLMCMLLFLKSLYQSNQLLGNSRLSKVRLLQSYEVYFDSVMWTELYDPVLLRGQILPCLIFSHRNVNSTFPLSEFIELRF